MYELRVKGDFAAAHQLKNVREKCENLHGHNFRVELAVEGEKLNDAGVLMDFGLLKSYLSEVLDSLDHCFLNEHQAFLDENASSENIAYFIAVELKEKLKDLKPSLRVKSVRIWESLSASAIYYP